MSAPRRTSARATFHALGLALAVGASLQAQAGGTVFCPGNSDDLLSMMASAAQGGRDFDIRIRSGVYLTPPSEVFRIAANPGFTVTVSGGWNSSCLIQTLDPTLTVLDGNNQGAALQANHVGGFTTKTLPAAACRSPPPKVRRPCCSTA
jgi:hypothetical protein